MGWVIFLIVLAYIASVALQLALAPVVICLIAAGGTAYVLYVLVGQLWELRSVTHTGAGLSPVPAPSAGGAAGAVDERPDEPAYLSYVAAQMWRDVWKVVQRSAGRLTTVTVGAHRRLYKAMIEDELWIFAWPTWVSIWLGTVALGVPVGLAAAGFALLLLTVLATWAALWVVIVGVLGVVERTLLVLRRIMVACPHPGCHRRFGLPAYACPSDTCAERHWRLVPNLHGALRHVCACGARLPTLILLGRFRLSAYCPALNCRRPLPKRAGRVRVEHIPIVGGNNAGKSTFLALSVGALRNQVEKNGGELGFEDVRDEHAITRALAQLRQGERVDKTIVELPRALMLDVRPAGSDGRILYFFDPAGEYYNSKEMVDSQRYLDNAEVVLLVVDPLALDMVQRGLNQAERRRIVAVAPANRANVTPEGPGAVVDRLLSYLQTRDGGARLRRVLVVVSKTDIMRSTAIGKALRRRYPDVKAWLTDVGWGNSVRMLDRYADEVRYLASGLDMTDAGFAEPISWLVGIDTTTGPGKARRRYATWRPWVSPSRPDQIPVSYRNGRITLLVLGPVASLLSFGFGIVAVVRMILSN